MIDFVLRNLIELASLPGSVPKLRSFILDQAVRGNLTADWRQEHPEIEPASVLLERIREEKRELVKAGKIKKQKELPPVEPGEVPFEVPKSWEWVRLAEAFLTVTDGDHLPPPKVQDGVPFLVIGNVRDGKIKTADSSRFVSKEYYKALDWSRKPRTGTILYTLVGSFGIPVLVRSDLEFCVQRHIGLLQPSSRTNVEYLRHLMASNLAFRQASNVATGIAQKTVPLSGLRSIALPIAPLAEQTEIVRRVDELMALCDRLEAAQNHRDDTRRRALTAGATQLTDDTADQPFADIWPRFTARLPELIQHPGDIKPVQDAILQLAVRGHLTADWRATHPDTEPASTLITRIKEEKQAMVNAGKIKKQKELPPVEPEEVPFDVPKGWEWVRLGDAIELVSGQHLKPGEYTEHTTGIPYLTGPAEFGVLHPNPSRYTEIRRAVAAAEDVLLTVKGAGVGKINIVDINEIAISRQLMAVRPIGDLSTHFVYRFLSTAYRELNGASFGIAIPGIGRDYVLARYFPLPPFAEQTEIVRRVDELMTACTALEKSTTTKTARAELLVERALSTK